VWIQQLTAGVDAHTPAIHYLLDKARDKFAQICGYEGREDISGELGVAEAKKEMAKKLDPRDWSGINLESLIDLVVDPPVEFEG